MVWVKENKDYFSTYVNFGSDIAYWLFTHSNVKIFGPGNDFFTAYKFGFDCSIYTSTKFLTAPRTVNGFLANALGSFFSIYTHI